MADITTGDFLLGQDTVSGKEGIVTVNIPGITDGPVVAAEVKNITGKVTKTKAKLRTMGRRGTQSKTTGWEGTGSMTFYMVTSLWMRLMAMYTNEGKDVFFDIHVRNDDPSSNRGAYQCHLGQCNIDEVDVAKFDVDADYLEITVNFTFSEYSIDPTASFNDRF